MSQLNKKPGSSIPGIYTDKHNRYVYYQKKNKLGIVIPPEDLRKWNLYRSRFFLPIVFALLLYSLAPEYIYFEIAGAIALMIYLEFAYRKALNNYVTIENFEPDENQSPQKQLDNAPKAKLIVLAVLYLAMTVLLCAYMFTYDSSQVFEIAIIVIADLFFLYQTIFYFRAFFKARKK